MPDCTGDGYGRTCRDAVCPGGCTQEELDDLARLQPSPPDPYGTDPS